MRRVIDPDNLEVKQVNGNVHVWYRYDEGVSGTINISPALAKKLMEDLDAILLFMEERQS